MQLSLWRQSITREFKTARIEKAVAVAAWCKY